MEKTIEEKTREIEDERRELINEHRQCAVAKFKVEIAPIVIGMIGLAPGISLTLEREKSAVFEQWCILENRIRKLAELIAGDDEKPATTNKIPACHTSGNEPLET